MPPDGRVASGIEEQPEGKVAGADGRQNVPVPLVGRGENREAAPIWVGKDAEEGCGRWRARKLQRMDGEEATRPRHARLVRAARMRVAREGRRWKISRRSSLRESMVAWSGLVQLIRGVL